MFTGWAFVTDGPIGQKKICVNTMWRIIHLSSLNLFKHHQQSVCAIIIITTTTILPRGCQYVEATREQFDLAWDLWRLKCAPFVSTLLHFTSLVNFIIWPFSFVFLKCFDDRSWEVGVDRNRNTHWKHEKSQSHDLQCIAPFKSYLNHICSPFTSEQK